MDLLEASNRLVRLRCGGRCEGCGQHGPVDVHHRRARGSGGVHGKAVEVANSVRNLLALCRACHDRTEDADEWEECQALGWRISHQFDVDPREVPALIYTAQGQAWWQLTEDACFVWIDWAKSQRLSSEALRDRAWRCPRYTPSPTEAISGIWAR